MSIYDNLDEYIEYFSDVNKEFYISNQDIQGIMMKYINL